MTQTQTTPASSTSNGTHGGFDPVKHPIRILPDATEKWLVGGPGSRDRIGTREGGATWEEARKTIALHAKLDGERNDLGAGALDKLVVSYDGSGLLHVCKSEQRGTQIVPASDAMPLRKAAFAQLAERAGAPAAYLAKLPAKLTRACLMHGMTNAEEKTGGLIRLANGQARAIVSGRYAALDDALVLDQVERALEARGLLGTITVRGVAVGTTTVVRLSWGSQVTEVKKGDIVEHGLDITNGEIGNRSVGLTPSLFRLVCLNGLRVVTPGIARRFNHVGDAARLYEAFADAIPAAIEEAQGNANRLRQSVDSLINDVDAEFSGLGAFGFTASEGRQVARTAMADRGIALPENTAEWSTLLDEMHDVSAFEIVNGMTAFAQTKGTDRRLEIEEAAGRYLRARTAA